MTERKRMSKSSKAKKKRRVTKKKAEKRSVGRPTKKTSENVETIERLIGMGLSDATAAQAIGIAESTLSKWKKEDHAFSERVSVARAKARAYAAGKMRELFDATSESVRFQAVQFWLRCRAPEFQDRQIIVEEDGGDYNANEAYL